MLARVNAPNHVRTRVEADRRLQTNGQWANMDAANAVPTFPVVDENYLRGLTFGVYQLRLAEDYAAEHMENGTYNVSYCC